MDKYRERIGIRKARGKTDKAKVRGRKTKGEESEEVSLNWESITEACVEQLLSVSRKHTEMCSSAEAL